ncbi:MAG: sensor histidine kinase [Pirellulales bacterium]
MAVDLPSRAGGRDSAPAWEPRASELFHQQQQQLDRWMDRSMAPLFLIQWMFQIALAAWVSPLTWGASRAVAPQHIWLAVALGGAVIALPLALIYLRPGRRSTRLVIAVAQGASVGILIHLTGGRLETYFYVFVSLALLAFYRDVAVLATMSIVVAVDSLARGYYWPQAAFGVSNGRALNFVEFVCWVVMADVYLWMLCRHSLRASWTTAQRQAELELTNDEMAMVNHCLLQEIRHRQRTQQELERAKNSAEAANRAKSEFLANMSHELRTPLNAVIGFSDVLAEQVCGPLNENQTQYVTDILDSGQHLLALVNDILDLAKIEAGSMDIHPARLDAAALVDRTVQMFRERAIRQGIRLAGSVTGEVHLYADERRLKQLLYNLLSNALKFTPEGGEVRVAVQQVGEHVEVRVSDTGIGIAATERDRVFESFYQIDSSLAKNAQGTGLGLAVVRQIVELHGGSVRVESEPGEGSTFVVLLPQAKAANELSAEVNNECLAAAAVPAD